MPELVPVPSSLNVSPCNPNSLSGLLANDTRITRMPSRDQQPCKFISTKESVYIRKEWNSHRIGLVNQHGHRFIVFGNRYGCRDVMCIRSSRDQQPRKFIGTKESVNTRKELNSDRIGLLNQHGRRHCFGSQNGYRDVMCMRSFALFCALFVAQSVEHRKI